MSARWEAPASFRYGAPMLPSVPSQPHPSALPRYCGAGPSYLQNPLTQPARCPTLTDRPLVRDQGPRRFAQPWAAGVQPHAAAQPRPSPVLYSLAMSLGGVRNCPPADHRSHFDRHYFSCHRCRLMRAQRRPCTAVLMALPPVVQGLYCHGTHAVRSPARPQHLRLGLTRPPLFPTAPFPRCACSAHVVQGL